jgi:hypothetical protein
VRWHRETALSATAVLPELTGQTESPCETEARPADPAPETAPAPTQPFRTNAAFRRCWQQWVGVLETFFAGGRLSVDDASYRTLRASLLEHCRAPAAGGPRPAVLGVVEGIVEPWLTLQALARTDRETLSSLLLRCHQLDGELTSRLGGRAWLLVPLALLAVIGGLGWCLVRWQDLPAAVKPLAGRAWMFIEANPLLFVGIALPAVVCGVVFLFSRILRA